MFKKYVDALSYKRDRPLTSLPSDYARNTAEYYSTCIASRHDLEKLTLTYCFINGVSILYFFITQGGVMKRMAAMVLVAFASTGVFATEVTIDPAKLIPASMNHEYLSTSSHRLYMNNPDNMAEYTVVFYLHPSLQSSPSAKSDPISINCNGNELMLAPGSSFACTVDPMQKRNGLSYHINSDYARNGANLSTAYIQTA